MSAPDILTVTGLILDAIGIVLLFLYAPEKFPDPQFGVGFSLEDDSRDKWRKEQAKKNKIAKCGVSIIVLGFALQALSVIFW